MEKQDLLNNLIEIDTSNMISDFDEMMEDKHKLEQDISNLIGEFIKNHLEDKDCLNLDIKYNVNYLNCQTKLMLTF